MSVNPNDLIITSLETIDAFSLQDEYLWTLDELSQAQIQNTEDTEDVTGKNGRLLKTLKRNKSVTISGTNGVISGGMMATQVGSKFVQGSDKKVRVTEFITVDTTASTGNFADNVLTLANSGVYAVKKTLTDGTTTDLDKKAADATLATGQYKITGSGITFFAGDITNGNVLVVTYDKTVTGSSVDNIADNEHYADTVKLYINAFAEDKCGKVYRIQFYVPKADFSGSFDIELGGSQVTHAFEAKSLAGGCGALTNRGLLWTYTVFEDAA